MFKMFGSICDFRCSIAGVFVFFVFVRMEEVTDGDITSLMYTSSDSLNLTVLNSSCWVNDDCNVAADLTRVHLDFTFLVILNCKHTKITAGSGGDDGGGSNRHMFAQQYSNISKVALDGCSVNRADTLGVEFVPDPSAVRTLSIQMFRIVGDIPADAFVKYNQLDYLNLTDNVIDGVSSASLNGLSSLKSLTLSNCYLRYLDDVALVHLKQLRNLFIQEPWLNITCSLQLPDVVRMVLEINTLDWCFRLPESLEEISVIKTQVYIVPNREEALSNLSRLKTFTLVHTNVTEWPTILSNSLQVLNLSHNQLETLTNHNLPTLHTYDVSSNYLHEINNKSLRLMPKLKSFYAQNNKLESISPNAFTQNPNLQHVDLTANNLFQFSPNMPAQQDVLILVDDNDWSCRWADDFSTSNPQVFARFRYAKVLDSLNTRGLRCKFYEQSSLQNHIARQAMANISTSTPILLRRNPKDTAMLTLIILVVGVAILFLMLFLHIKCRQDGLPQFNRFLPADSILHHQQMAERIDFVRRKLPPTEYEEPICLRTIPPPYDVSKRKTDEGIVYEEIPDRDSSKSSVQADNHSEDSSPAEEAIRSPSEPKVLHRNTLYDQLKTTTALNEPHL